MTSRDLYIAAYDISCPRRLRKALRVLRDFSTGGQKSVFECFLTKVEKNELLDAVRGVIDATEDRFFVVKVEPRSRVHVLGIAVAPSDPPFYYLGERK